MWKKFNKKIKKIIMTKKIYNLQYGEFTYPITKQLIFDGRKNKVLNNKINLEIPVILFHGEKDDVVSSDSSKIAFQLIKKAGFNVDLMIYSGKHKIGINYIKKMKSIIKQNNIMY